MKLVGRERVKAVQLIISIPGPISVILMPVKLMVVNCPAIMSFVAVPSGIHQRLSTPPAATG
jgi:hypothetical protein